ncbi:MAG: response regulator transcription factor [Clostridiales Family XIII bacterium]|jgi:DNA-binding response OmpR family regulator|nr:response regulator transcription factor [Clostridiales Family XIII bacterium]
MRTILCVEDDRTILRNNRGALEDSGYRALTATNLAEARARLSEEAVDAIVLDIMLPDGNGLELLENLRNSGDKIPIIMLTAWGEPQDVSRGLSLGANDYLSKPFDYSVLLARVEAMFRNVEQMPDIIEKGALTLDVVADQAFICGRDMLLTQKEFALLLLFAQNEDRVMSAEYLYEKAWRRPMVGDNSVKVTVSKLRKKMEGSGYTISAVYGEGYTFERA